MSTDTGGWADDMTLLDWFAGQALAGYRSYSVRQSEKVVRYAYEDAAFMVAEKRRLEAAAQKGKDTHGHTSA